MPIDRDEVERIARLARIQLDAATAKQFGAQLETILDYVAQLDELSLEDTPSTTERPGESPHLREDRPHACLSQDEALRSAPDADDGHFRVPGVMERS